MKIDFYTKDSHLEKAVSEYQSIWQSEGENIILIWESLTGLSFTDKSIHAEIVDGMSRSHPLQLRYSYPKKIKISMLTHELGHILLSTYTSDTPGLETHKTMFLVFYDVLNELYGKDFANYVVEWESNNLPKEIYKEAWDYALSFTHEEGLIKFKERISS